MNNPWLLFSICVWVVCGAVAVILRDKDPLLPASVITVLEGLLYLALHG